MGGFGYGGVAPHRDILLPWGGGFEPPLAAYPPMRIEVTGPGPAAAFCPLSVRPSVCQHFHCFPEVAPDFGAQNPTPFSRTGAHPSTSGHP